MQAPIERDKSNSTNNLVLDETAPLLNQKKHRALTLSKAKATSACCCLLTVSATTAIILYLNSKEKEIIDSSNIHYSFTVPYKGAGSIVIHNENDFSIEITQIEFVTNALINTQAVGAVYGELAPYGETTIEQVASENNWQTYKLTEPSNQIISIPPNTNKNFTYVFEKALGIVNAIALPTDLSLITNEGTYALTLANQCQKEECLDPFNGKVVGGYYTNWDMYGREYPAKNIPVTKLNTIYYAFINYDRNGNISLLDSNADNIQLPALMQLQQQNPYLKILLSFGGYSLSSEFPLLAQNPTAIENFSTNVLTMLQQFGFSGVDIDWEFPTASDSNNFLQLLKTLRSRLDASGKKYLITLATSAGKDKIDAVGDNWKEIAAYIDYINLMAYDMNGAWSPRSDYQSPLYLPYQDPNGQMLAINASIPFYENYHFPKEKISLGIPAYFRGVTVSNMQQNGMWQPVTGTPNGQYEQSGIYEYTCAISGTCYGGNKLPSDCLYLDEEHTFYGQYSQTPSISCPSELAVFTGDSTHSVQSKSCFVSKNNLKGVFFWALSGDERNDEQKSLLATASKAFRDSPCTSEIQQERTLDHTPPVITNDQEWQDFVNKVQSNVVHSYLGGIAMTVFFQTIDKITEQLLKKMLPNKLVSNVDQASLYYSVKTVVYFSTLYYLGAPMLPVAISKLLVQILQSLGCSNEKSALSGTMASFCMSIGNLDLTNPQEISIATISFLSSLAGGMTPSLLSQLSVVKNFTASTCDKISKWSSALKNVSFFNTRNESSNDEDSFEFENDNVLKV